MSGENTVPDFVPTLCIAGLFTLTTLDGSIVPKCLKLRNDGQYCATVVPAAKSLILLGITIRNQQVAGSIPAGGSNDSKRYFHDQVSPVVRTIIGPNQN